MKNFYARHKVMPKVHIENTNLPIHLDEMLNILIEEDRKKYETTNASTNQSQHNKSPQLPSTCNGSGTTHSTSTECFDFVLTNRPLDLLTEICLTDAPAGASAAVLNWMRRFLTCLHQPRLDHKSILQPTQVHSGLFNHTNDSANKHFQFYAKIFSASSESRS